MLVRIINLKKRLSIFTNKTKNNKHCIALRTIILSNYPNNNTQINVSSNNTSTKTAILIN